MIALMTDSFVLDEGEVEDAVAAYWVSDGIDRCRVGFLPRYLVPSRHEYDGHLAQIVEMYTRSQNGYERRRSNANRGMCRAALLTK
jgi:hypothetical protein